MDLPSPTVVAAVKVERFQAKWMPVRVKKTRQTKRKSPAPIPSERKWL
jgi:hypothetical protein